MSAEPYLFDRIIKFNEKYCYNGGLKIEDIKKVRCLRFDYI